MSALSALLIIVGWRLANPSQFKQAFKIGPDHISAFVVTLVMTLAFDLLIGILSGLIVEFLFALNMGVKLKSLFKSEYHTKIKENNEVVIKTTSPLIFSNTLGLRMHMLEFLGSAKNVTVDLTSTKFIDHSVMEQFKTIGEGFRERGMDLKIITSPKHRAFSIHELSSRRI
jgi:MFS superfamily sulfate permease-like transporter